jgi:hypothetical protein
MTWRSAFAQPSVRSTPVGASGSILTGLLLFPDSWLAQRPPRRVPCEGAARQSGDRSYHSTGLPSAALGLG